MQQNIKDLCLLPHTEEELTIEQRAEIAFRAALSQPGVGEGLSLEETRAAVADLAEKIRELEAQRLQPHTWEMIDTLATMRAARAFYSWRTFPINNLPVEILEHIFSLAVYSPAFLNVSRTRMALVAVCSRWRSVIVNTPELWSIIPVTCPAPFYYPILCIQRAKAHPLILFIDQRDRQWNRSETDHRFGPVEMRVLFTHIATFMHQVQQLLILADTWAVIRVALDILQTVPAPRLMERLEIHRSGHAYVEFGQGPSSKLATSYRLFGGAQATSLSHISLSGVPVDFSPAPFRNLRVFELRKLAVEHMPTLEDFLPVLQGSPQLERLLFDGACPQLSKDCVGKAGLWKPVLLKNLRELTIGNLIPDYAIYVLQLIVAPELRRLALERLVNEDFTRFVEKLPGRFPKVMVLTVNGLGTESTTALLLWLQTLTNLRYLKVSRVADEFLDAFLNRVPESFAAGVQHKPRFVPVCERLEVFEIVKCSSMNFQTIQRFVEGRASMQVPLRRILVPKGELDGGKTLQEVWMRRTGILSSIPPGARPDLSSRYNSD
ncbi:hypothetical protein DFH11DRAFT_21656 [Phellopilus nigrolimitatus]|nr:hypothetical protein DFH11DRAFT_21656 [Phellopilus nigrolimitatus]